MMKCKKNNPLFCLIIFEACITNDIQNVVRVTLSRYPVTDAKNLASGKVVYYALNPKQSASDLAQFIKNLIDFKG